MRSAGHILYRLLLGLLPFAKPNDRRPKNGDRLSTQNLYEDTLHFDTGLLSTIFGGTLAQNNFSRRRPRQQINGLRSGGGIERHGDKVQTVFAHPDVDQHPSAHGRQHQSNLNPGKKHGVGNGNRDAAPFAQPGTRIDITVAAIGDSSNLQGGMLLLTPLKAWTDLRGRAGKSADRRVHRRPWQQHSNRESPGGRPGPGRRHCRASAAIAASRSETQAAIAPGRFHDRGPRGRGREQTLRPGRTTAGARGKLGLVSVVASGGIPSRPVEFVAEMESLTVEADHLRKNRH